MVMRTRRKQRVHVRVPGICARKAKGIYDKHQKSNIVIISQYKSLCNYMQKYV